jgi:glycine cleavage system aminomethyltransferase T
MAAEGIPTGSRDGSRSRRTFGHVAPEVAACRTSAGVGVLCDMAVLEVSGRPLALQRVVRQLLGQRTAVGSTHPLDGGWLCLLATHRALVVVPTALRAALATRVQAACRQASDVSVVDLSERYGLLAVVGPAAGALVAATAASVAAAVLSTGHDRYFVVVAAGAAVAAHREILEAGRALGAVAVGREAFELVRVGDAVTDCQRPVTSPPHRIATTLPSCAG